jgi:hypothetical protein
MSEGDSEPRQGGIWVLDQATAEFVWVTPWPLDVPNLHIAKVNADTGRT